MSEFEETVAEPAWMGGRVPLISFPILATFGTLFLCWYAMYGDPFGGVTYQDFGVMVGGPILLLGLWIKWFWMVYTYRLHPLVWGSVLLWCLLTMFFVGGLMWDFFHSPWTYYVPPGGRGPIPIFRME